ncbi:hypothetical protein ACMBCN_01265 [Candidatus Liberibacter asiaticus]
MRNEVMHRIESLSIYLSIYLHMHRRKYLSSSSNSSYLHTYNYLKILLKNL